MALAWMAGNDGEAGRCTYIGTPVISCQLKASHYASPTKLVEEQFRKEPVYYVEWRLGAKYGSWIMKMAQRSWIWELFRCLLAATFQCKAVEAPCKKVHALMLWERIPSRPSARYTNPLLWLNCDWLTMYLNAVIASVSKQLQPCEWGQVPTFSDSDALPICLSFTVHIPTQSHTIHCILISLLWLI
jgi:hypothetical protein